MTKVHWIIRGSANTKPTRQHQYLRGDATTICGLYVPEDTVKFFGDYGLPDCVACDKKLSIAERQVTRLVDYMRGSRATINNG